MPPHQSLVRARLAVHEGGHDVLLSKLDGVVGGQEIGVASALMAASVSSTGRIIRILVLSFF
jgi:hypothetical protein